MTRARKLIADFDACLIVAGDILITCVLLREVAAGAGVSVGWLAMGIPIAVANAISGYFALRFKLTSMPMGPNTVFIFGFGAAVAPRLLVGDVAHQGASLFADALLVYTAVLVAVTMILNALGKYLTRTALLLPLAALCWCYLVATSLHRLLDKSWIVGASALGLLCLLMLRVPAWITWPLAVTAWYLLGGDVADSDPGAALLPQALELGQWLGRDAFWVQGFPIVVTLAIGNALGVLENIATADAVGERHRPKDVVFGMSVGTLVGVATKACAPITVYIGHPALKNRGATYRYSFVLALLFIALAITEPEFLFSKQPAVFFGTVIYVGLTIGLLPVKQLGGARDWGLAAVSVAPIFLGWAKTQWNLDDPYLDIICRGAGIVSVGWALIAFSSQRYVRSVVCALLGCTTFAGMTHGAFLSTTAWVVGVLYWIAALVIWFASASRPPRTGQQRAAPSPPSVAGGL